MLDLTIEVTVVIPANVIRQCYFNVGPASHTVIQHSADRATSQCIDWGPSECVSICQTNMRVLKVQKLGGDLILIFKI